MHFPLSETIKLLRHDASRSATARSLILAASSLEEVLALTQSGEVMPYGECERIVELLSKVFSTNNGELVVDAKSCGPSLRRAYFCAQEVAFERLYAVLYPQSTREQRTYAFVTFDDADVSVSLEVMLSQADKIAVGPWRSTLQSSVQGPGLADALLVLSMLALFSSESIAMNMIDAACRMDLADSRLYTLRGWMNANRMANSLDNDPPHGNVESLVAAVIDDSERALKLNNDRSSLFMKAYALRSIVFMQLSDDQQFATRMQRECEGLTKSLQLAVETYEKYIDRAEPCDRHLPSAHYDAGLMHVIHASLSQHKFKQDRIALVEKARAHYTSGLRAEERRLRFFGQVNTDSKGMLGVALLQKKEDWQAQFDTEDKSTAARTPQPLVASPPGTQAVIQNQDFDAEVQTLLQDEKQLSVASFKKSYQEKFGKPVVLAKGETLAARLQKSAEDSRAYQVEWRGTPPNPWITLSVDIKPGTQAVIPNPDFDAEVRALLQDEKQLSVASFKKSYQDKFGKPVVLAKGETLTARLQKSAKDSRACKVEWRGTPPNPWIIFPG